MFVCSSSFFSFFTPFLQFPDFMSKANCAGLLSLSHLFFFSSLLMCKSGRFAEQVMAFFRLSAGLELRRTHGTVLPGFPRPFGPVSVSVGSPLCEHGRLPLSGDFTAFSIVVPWNLLHSVCLEV